MFVIVCLLGAHHFIPATAMLLSGYAVMQDQLSAASRLSHSISVCDSMMATLSEVAHISEHDVIEQTIKILITA